MPECAQVCALHKRLQSTALGDAKENRNGRRLSSYRRINRKTGITSLTFWLTLYNPVTDGSKHMRQLDRGEINLFSLNSGNGEKFEIFSKFLAYPVETPWPILTVLHQNVRRSVPYILDYIWHR